MLSKTIIPYSPLFFRGLFIMTGMIPEYANFKGAVRLIIHRPSESVIVEDANDGRYFIARLGKYVKAASRETLLANFKLCGEVARAYEAFRNNDPYSECYEGSTIPSLNALRAVAPELFRRASNAA